MAALNPNLWVNDAAVMSETFVVLFVASILLGLYAFIDRPRWRIAAGLGALFGLAALTRGEQALLGPIAIAPSILLARSWPLPRRIAAIALCGATAFAVLTPWVAYNASRFERPLLIASNLGETLLGANSETPMMTSSGSITEKVRASCPQRSTGRTSRVMRTIKGCTM